MSKKWLVASLCFLALVVGVIAVLDVTDAAATTWDHSKAWNGVNGADNNLAGYDLLWVLGGSGATSAELQITLSDGSHQTITGDKQGNGAFHFTSQGVAGATVTAATVYWMGEDVNAPLTISHTIGDPETTTTTTTSDEETTTTSSSTTTTERETTTTTTEKHEDTTTTTKHKGTTTTTFEAELG
jgi:hypothetical protein